MQYHRLVMAVFLLSLVSSVSCASEYYVATDGDDNNSGTSIDSPWRTLVHAASSPLLTPGDIVYVRAGYTDDDVYGGNVVFSRGGVEGSPVIFAGYTSTPGDNPDLNYQLDDPLQATVMPLF